MDTYFRQSGPRVSTGQKTIVFLHGFPFDGSIWDPQLRSLPPGWRGIAPDLRGFGKSPLERRAAGVPSGKKAGAGVAGDSEPVLTMGRLADDAAELIQAEVEGPAVVCGLSMGGYVVFELWRRHPELVRALVLADTRAEADSDEGRENRLRMAHTAREEGSGAIARTMVSGLLAPKTMEQQPELAARVRDMIEATTPETIIAALAGMAGRRESGATLPTIDVPTLVLVGDHDPITPVDSARALADGIPGARLQVVPDAGHLSNLENPRAFNTALYGFLRGLED